MSENEKEQPNKKPTPPPVDKKLYGQIKQGSDNKKPAKKEKD